ncbi:MAG: TRAP transporter substrate-binding protein [Betaproteobacteria bacterium]|nr:TRAP transporter substrate-binding protein [Betaproteobacteria bacterium]
MTTKIRTAVCAAIVCLAAISGGAQAQTHELKVSMFAAPSNPLNVQFGRMAKELEAKSKGRLKLTLFPVSQLGPPPRQYDLVRTGVADMAYILHGLTPGRFPLTELVELPGLASTAFMANMALMDLLPEYLAAEHAGVRVLSFISTPPVPLMMTKIEPRTIADLKGRRIRHSGPVQSATLAALGAVPVAVQPADLNESLSKGVIDGAVVGYSGVTSFKLQDVLRYMNDMNLGVVTFAAVMNPASYERLPADLKKLIDEYAGPAAERTFWADVLDGGESSQRDITLKAGVKPVQLDPRAQEEFKAISAKLEESTVADLEKKGLPARAFLLKLKATLAKYAPAKK